MHAYGKAATVVVVGAGGVALSTTSPDVAMFAILAIAIVIIVVLALPSR